MAKRSPNPNTAYGRKRLRQEYELRKAAMTPEERSKHEADSAIWTFLILVIIGLIIFMIGGSDALVKWLRR